MALYDDASGRRTAVRNESTRYRLAQAMKICMQKKSVDDITVKNIVEQCGVTRQTFYRNFQDKYDLVNWYFDKLLHRSFEHMGQGKTINEGLERKFGYIRQERAFFAAGFRSDDRNSLKEHDFELIFQFYIHLLEEKSGRSLSKEMAFLLEFYCRGSVDMTVKWVLCGMKESPEYLAQALVKALPVPLFKLADQMGLLR